MLEKKLHLHWHMHSLDRPISLQFALLGVLGAIYLALATALFAQDAANKTVEQPNEIESEEVDSAQSVESDTPPDNSADVSSTDSLVSDKQRKASIIRWESSIQQLEKLDDTKTHPDDAVLLVGSSSIRLWSNAAEALAPYPIIQRGFGGSRFNDLYVYATRLIEPHTYRAIVLFVANDVCGRDDDHEVEDVEQWVRAIIQVARDHQPESPILFLEVTPTPSRFQAWPQIRKLNAMLYEVALTEPNVSFITTAEFYLDRNDEPRPELFRGDRLHQNEAGYELWASLIKRRLDEVLKNTPSR